MKSKILFIFIALITVLGLIGFTAALSGAEGEGGGIFDVFDSESETEGSSDDSGDESEETYSVTFNQKGTMLYRTYVKSGDNFFIPDLAVEFPTTGDYILDYWSGSDGNKYEVGYFYNSPSTDIVLTPVFILRDSEGSSESICSHSYTFEVTSAATCNSFDVRTYTCTSCGDSYIANGTSYNSNNHANKVAGSYIDSTYHSATCSACGATFNEAHYVPAGASGCVCGGPAVG